MYVEVLNMEQTNINIRIDAKLKKQFDTLCNELGLTMTTAVNIFARTMVREQRIPFEVGLNTPNKETLAAIKDVQSGTNLFGPFDNTEDLFKDLDA